MAHSLNRRDMLLGTGAFACAVLGTSRRASAAPKAVVHELRVISWQPDLYHGWPTVARCKSGELLLVCSGGRRRTSARSAAWNSWCSRDEGATWGWPRVVLDLEIDDRDSGVLETAKGTILATTFTSLAYVSELKKAEKTPPGSPALGRPIA